MKPDDQLTNDSPIAPPDHRESTHEQPIRHVDPHATLEEDDEAFNEFQMPGEHLDLTAAHPAGGQTLDTPILASKSEVFRPVPGWVVAGGALLVLWAGIYLGTYNGGWSADVFNEQANYKPAGPTGPVDPIVASKGRGQKLFIANCAQCHQANGLGAPGQFPPLVGSEWVVTDSTKRLAQILLHGIQGAIHVKGAVYNNAMPAWNVTLKDKQIADVLTYVRGELGGNAAGPILEAQIAAARKETDGHNDSWNEAELMAMPAGPMDGGESSAPAPGAAPQTTANPPAAAGGAQKPAATQAGQGPAPTTTAPKP